MLKKTVLAVVFGVFAFACSSDCLECHPKLKPLEYDKNNKYYKEHHFLITCTKCHPNHNDKMTECGADCFDCHSRQKLINTPIPEHQRLNTCTKCHKDTIHDIIPSQPNNNFLNLGGKN
jgi:hypothetical protein